MFRGKSAGNNQTGKLGSERRARKPAPGRVRVSAAIHMAYKNQPTNICSVQQTDKNRTANVARQTNKPTEASHSSVKGSLIVGCFFCRLVGRVVGWSGCVCRTQAGTIRQNRHLRQTLTRRPRCAQHQVLPQTVAGSVLHLRVPRRLKLIVLQVGATAVCHYDIHACVQYACVRQLFKEPQQYRHQCRSFALTCKHITRQHAGKRNRNANTEVMQSDMFSARPQH